MSLSARRAWIEIESKLAYYSPSPKSLSARRAWIEIENSLNMSCSVEKVALRKESVDRNIIFRTLMISLAVALRKESVDRNNGISLIIHIGGSRSPQGERG